MQRFKSQDIVEIGRLHSGTSAQFIGYNTRTNKKGIYKENGCILGIDNDDIREKLSSDILRTLEIPCADIDLVYDEQNNRNSYFSNYIIEDNEELIVPDTSGLEGSSKDPIDNLYERYIGGVRKLTTDEQALASARKNFYSYTYMCCILDSYDIKPDNLPLVHNKETSALYPAPWFDFGTAFCKDHKSAPIYEMSTDKMMESLFKNHYEDIKEVVGKVNTTLTQDKLNELFSNEYLIETFSEGEIKKIRSRLDSQIAKSKGLEIITSKGRSPNKFKSFILSIKSKLGNIFNKDKHKQLPEDTTYTTPTKPLDASFIDNLHSLANESIEYKDYPPTEHTPKEL